MPLNNVEKDKTGAHYTSLLNLLKTELQKENDHDWFRKITFGLLPVLHSPLIGETNAHLAGLSQYYHSSEENKKLVQLWMKCMSLRVC